MFDMMKIGKGKMDAKSMVRYIVDGLKDDARTKLTLYEATTTDELKKKLRIYEATQVHKDTPTKTAEQNHNKDNSKNGPKNTKHCDKRCYNCGDKNHYGYECPDKEKIFFNCDVRTWAHI